MASLSVDACVSRAMAADGSVPADVKQALGTHSLLSICKALRDYLCEMDRVQPAMRLLAAIAVERSDLSSTDVRLLLTFFAEKLAQLEHQTAALSCLALLISDVRQRFPCSVEWFEILATPFTAYVRVQQLPLNCRKQCFCIMTYLFTETTVPTCRSDTLAALLDLLDGESDPELVLETFNLHVVVATRATTAALSPVLDDYFESVSSYFPVVFSQPPGCRVTKTDLRTHLKRCLCLAVYSECCIPFMQGKLASPSIAVKEDVLDVLLTCFDTYRHGAMAAYHASLVVHMKNEVVKLSSFSDRAASPALTRCIFMCCEVLGRVSKACDVKSQTAALEVFGPVLEGYLSALSADTAISSAYATMVFHVLTGSWDCCLYVASYLFSMLSMSLADAEHAANAYMLFAALVTGMLDALAAFPGEGRDSAMCGAIERSTPPVAEAVQQAVSRWAPLVSAGDDFAVVCGCEFVVAVLKLAQRLHRWLAAGDVSCGVDALVWAALHCSAEASAKICKLVRDLAEEDGAAVRAALLRLLEASDVPAERGLVVACELACTSTEALLLAYEQGFLSATCAWMAAVPPAQRADALHRALDHFGAALREGEAGRMTALLTRDDVPPDYFLCACFVARNLAPAATAEMASGGVAVSLLGVAALLASRRIGDGATLPWAALVGQLVSLADGQSSPWRRVGMEGVTGAVLSGVAGDVGSAAVSQDGRLRVAVAALWGGLLSRSAAEVPLAAGAEDAEGEEDDPVHVQLVSSFAQQCMGGNSADGSCASSAATVEAFTYLPFLAHHSVRRPSLLRLLLRCGEQQSLFANVTFCTAIQCLVESETDARVTACLAQLLAVLGELTRSSGPGESSLARALIFSVNGKCGGDPALARAVLFTASSVRVLLDGAADDALLTRQRSLQLLTSLAKGAVTIAGSCTPDDKATLLGVRDEVLRAVKAALGDHKRKVRQAAGSCAHEWFKVR